MSVLFLGEGITCVQKSLPRYTRSEVDDQVDIYQLREVSFFYNKGGGGSRNLGEHMNFGNQKEEQKNFSVL